MIWARHAKQYMHDVALMRQRWRSVLDADPFYNRNLSLEREYKLAFPPRIPVSDNLCPPAAEKSVVVEQIR